MNSNERPYKTRFIVSWDLLVFIVANVIWVLLLWDEDIIIEGLMLILILELVFIYRFGSTAYYFILYPEMLEIKNKWFFWFGRSVNLGEIKFIKIEHIIRVGIALVLINSNGKKKIYPFNQISKEDVKELCARLEALGVRIEYMYPSDKPQ